MTNEDIRLAESRTRKKHWKRWGPYLSERAWGTVCEDHSSHGNAWKYLPHDHAPSRAYRWNEDGLAGISDRRQMICFALALRGREGILLLSRPHAFALLHEVSLQIPQAEFPCATLVEENRRCDKRQPEFELLDTGSFDEDRYFDVFVEYAKADVEDILIKITVTNRGPEKARKLSQRLPLQSRSDVMRKNEGL
jgi:hypothetical protein